MSSYSLEALKAARKRIADPGHWTRWWFARDSEGKRCEARERSKATRWCARGALMAEVHGPISETCIERYLESAAREQCPKASDPIVRLNDFHGHDAVLRAFDRAIELAESKP